MPNDTHRWPGATLLPHAGRLPETAAAAFVAPGARLIGAVLLGADSSVWYNCVLRGDVGTITVGARTNIQDGSVIHVDSGGHDTVIGADCLIGHLAMLHGCRLHDGAFVGLGSIVMDGCEIEADGMLAAGALLGPGKRVLAGDIWGGRPARPMRARRPEEIEAQRAGIARYAALGRLHATAVA